MSPENVEVKPSFADLIRTQPANIADFQDRRFYLSYWECYT